MTWPGFCRFIYFLFWHYLFPFLVRGGGGRGSTGLIQIKVPRILDFFFAHLLILPTAHSFVMLLHTTKQPEPVINSHCTYPNSQPSTHSPAKTMATVVTSSGVVGKVLRRDTAAMAESFVKGGV